jgi:hypothetical protein
MGYNQFQKLRDNVAAIKIALAHWNGQAARPEDQVALQAYSGFGGLKAVLFPAGDKQEWIDRNASQNDLKLYPSMMVNGVPPENQQLRKNKSLKI